MWTLELGLVELAMRGVDRVISYAWNCVSGSCPLNGRKRMLGNIY